ncbi:hypothetical protein [Micromonospora sp. NPDC047740]|uniref:hypothetical protein n=1 Tax=Micromonospora sp. NPDC047740 TaxID=3364254 RepID=UPI0037195DFE
MGLQVKRRLSRITAVAASLTVAVTLGIAGPASADDGIDWDHHWSVPGGDVYVEEHGDIVMVCDTKADGKGVHGLVKDYYTGIIAYEFDETAGAFTCIKLSASMGGRYNLVEGHYYGVSFYVGDSHEVGFWTNDH